MLHTNDFNTCYSPTLNLVGMGVKRIGMKYNIENSPNWPFMRWNEKKGRRL